MRRLPVIVVLAGIVAAACGGPGTASTSTPATGGGSSTVAAAPGPAATPASAGKYPTCERVLTPGELAGISTVDEWALTSWDDVMPDTDVTCQWDFKLNTPEWLHAEVHVWSDPQAASFLAGGLPGEAVPGLGDSAAWDPIGGRLLVQLGSRVLGVVPGSWLGPDGQEAGALAIARLVIPRLPG